MTEAQIIATRTAMVLDAQLAALQAEKNLIEAIIYGLRTLQVLQSCRGMGAPGGTEICPSKAGPAEALLESLERSDAEVSGTPDQGASVQPEAKS